MANLTAVTQLSDSSISISDRPENWVNSLTAATGGVLSGNLYRPGELVGAFESTDAVASGLVDIGWVFPTGQGTSDYLPATFPLVTHPGADASATLYDLLPRDDFTSRGLTVLAAWFDEPYILITQFPFSGDPSELSGRNIATSGEGAQFLQNLGANTQSVPTSGLLSAFSTGTIEGMLLSPHAVSLGGLESILGSGTTVVSFGAGQFLQGRAYTLVANSASLAGLTATERQALLDTTGSDLSSQLGAEALTTGAAERANVITAVQNAGGTHLTVTGTQLANWQTAADAYATTQITDNSLSAGAQALYNALSQSGTQGTLGDDTLTGTDANDTLSGGDGADSLLGLAGDDDLFGDQNTDAFETAAGQIHRLYLATLTRAPDHAGHNGWTTQLANGDITLASAVTGFVASAEFRFTYGGLDDPDFVTVLYNNVLLRDPTNAEITAWTDRMSAGTSRETVVMGFSESAEFQTASAAGARPYIQALYPQEWADDVYRLYRATLGRDPDLPGLQGWSDALGEGRGYAQVAAGFTGSAEFQATYGALDDTGFVTLLYQNVLNRLPDSAGLTGWTQQLASGTSRSDVVQGFAQSTEFITATSDSVKAWMRAQSGGDVLDGGAGVNRLTGGELADTFVFAQADGTTTTVTDLEAWDYLRFTGFSYANPSDAFNAMVQSGTDVVFSDQTVTVTFENTTLAQITDDMFV